MQTVRSACCAARLSRSATETATTASRPRAWQARITRTAISPRLATRTREMPIALGGLGANEEQRLLVLHELRVVDQDLDDDPAHPGEHAGEDLHRLDQAQ